MRWYMLLFILLLFGALVQSGCAQEREAMRAYGELQNAYVEQRKSEGALTTQEVQRWIDKFWRLRHAYPGTQAAAKATAQAIKLTWEIRDLNALEEKYREVSIDENAMIQLVAYIPSAVEYGKEVQEWRRIAKQSRNPDVRAAALFELAEHYFNHKRYSQVANLLDTLTSKYGISSEHDRYGPHITQMRESVRTLSVGSTLPSFRTVDIEGTIISSSQLKGNVVLLYFYGSGCGSCIKMYPTLNALYKKYREEDFYLLGISADRDFLTLEEFQAFLDDHGIKWPQTLERELFDSYKVGVLSTAFLLDKEGKLVWISESDQVLEAVKELRGKDLAEAVHILLNS